MTREEKIELIERERDGWQNDADDHKRRGCVAHYEHEQAMADVLTEAMTALRGPQPDPETGLVPCGCGGKPEVENIQYDGDNWRVTCKECQTAAFETVRESDGYWGGEESAKENWNRAMGYRDA